MPNLTSLVVSGPLDDSYQNEVKEQSHQSVCSVVTVAVCVTSSLLITVSFQLRYRNVVCLYSLARGPPTAVINYHDIFV